jgi:HSP20 family molecular chaperone IbpA
MARDTAIAKTQQPQPPVQSDRRTPVIPACDIYENKEEILLIADLPGVTPELLNIHLEKGELSLEARRALDAQPNSVATAEYSDCDFRRRFVVPTGIDSAKISAQLTNGVLELHLPKSDALKPREITVRAG